MNSDFKDFFTEEHKKIQFILRKFHKTILNLHALAIMVREYKL